MIPSTLKFLFISLDSQTRLWNCALGCLLLSGLLSFIVIPINLLTYEILLPQKNKSTLDYLLPFVDSIHLLMFVI